MTDQEREKLLLYMEEFRKKMEGDEELTKRFFMDIGITTENGELTEPYQHLPLYFSQIQKEAV
jgi:NADPH-dependent 7-cyano-7-deazaguanine reductase QueF